MTTATQPITDQARDDIKTLVRINHDSADGFEHAARNIPNSSLGALFNEEANVRRRYADELREAADVNAPSAEQGSALAKAHRWWMNVRGAVAQNEVNAVLAEAARGEQAIVERYADVMNETDGTIVHGLVKRQHAHVQASRRRLEELRQGWQA